MVAAAEVVAARGVVRKVKGQNLLSWQERAWQHYDDIGEFRFGVGWLANGMSRVNLVAARPPKNVGEEPTPLTLEDGALTAVERRAMELVEMIAGGASGQGQMMAEFGEHLSVAGFAWLVAEPALDDEIGDTFESWRVYSQDALRFEGQNDKQRIDVRVTDGTSSDSWRPLHANALVVKTWRKHPRRPWEPDAPCRAALTVLDIIDLLTAHVVASGRSRLAGAGILGIPSEAEFPPPPPSVDASGNVTEQDAFDYFVEQLTTAMTAPIADRDSAAGVVPLVVSIPGEYLDKMKHLDLATAFDAQLSTLLEEAIKRLALALDMPPEILTGMSGVNHWTAWQVEETAITLHIEPAAEIVCQALTEGWLAIALEAEGYDSSAALVWYDTSDLTSPPDKSANVVQAYDRLQASAATLRRELGLTEADAPNDEEFKQRVLLDAAKGAPTLAPSMLAKAGILPEEVAAVAESADSAAGAAKSTGELPDVSEGNTAPSKEQRPSGDRASAEAVLLACDGVVYRAMERAGARLKSRIGRSVEGGPQSVDHSEMTTLHTIYDPTIYADLDFLLEGAFERVPEIAAVLSIDDVELVSCLDAYCRGRLATRRAHDMRGLAHALAAESLVRG